MGGKSGRYLSSKRERPEERERLTVYVHQGCIQFKSWFQYREEGEAFIAVLPLFHVGGIAGVMNAPLAAAATIVLFRRFHPLGVLQAIQGYRASRFLGVPTMYITVLNQQEAPSFDLTSLRASRTSAAPLPEAVKKPSTLWWDMRSSLRDTA